MIPSNTRRHEQTSLSSIQMIKIICQNILLENQSIKILSLITQNMKQGLIQLMLCMKFVDEKKYNKI